MTRFARRRVWLSFCGYDEPQELIILSSFRDCGHWYYRCKMIDGGAIIDIQARSVDYVMHRKSRVRRLPVKLRVAK